MFHSYMISQGTHGFISFWGNIMSLVNLKSSRLLSNREENLGVKDTQ